MSMRIPHCRVGEHGFTFSMSTGLKPSAINSASIEFRKPDGTTVTKTCDDNDLTAGRYGWVVTDGFFDTPGWWEADLTVDLGAEGDRKQRNPKPFFVGAE